VSKNLIKKIIEANDQKKFYTCWINIIDETFSTATDCIDEAYDVKSKLDNSLSQLYVEKLMNYYSYLVKVHQVYIKNKNNQPTEVKQHNYNVIVNEVNILANKYMEFDDFVSSLRFLDNGQEAAYLVPLELLEFRNIIETQL